MTQYVDKSTLVAEIERRKKRMELFISLGDLSFERTVGHFNELLSFINTLEVKEVDLEKEVNSQMDLLCNLLCYMDELSNGDSEGVYPLPMNVKEDLQRFAKHFFELGMKTRKEE